MGIAIDTPDATPRMGSFNYLKPTVEHSLYRNGKVLTRRDRDGSDATWEGVDFEARQVPVHDARALTGAQARTLEHNGFEVRDLPLKPDIDFFDHEQVVQTYYPQCETAVRETTGAAVVAAFDHNVRSAQGKKDQRRIAGGQQVQGPAQMVHGDYTLTSAPQRLRDLTHPPGSNDTLRGVLAEGEALLDHDRVEQALANGRYAIVNLWRNIRDEPVVTHPLALCDAASVRPEDLVVFEIHYADRIGENYFARYAERHDWYCYPGLTRDEGLLIKQWDAAGELARTQGRQGDGEQASGPCTFSFHSAFEDMTTPSDAPDRWSIEVRCAVLYD